MTVAMSCPDRASLERLLDHGAGPDEVERLAGHLETCARCGETVETLLAGDRNAAALRGTKVEADAPSVQLLRARLAKLRPAGGSASPQDTSPSAEAVATAATLPPAALQSTPDQSLALAPPQQPDEIGRLGGYRILKELGRGGMGVVYQAEDVKLKRLVALKVMTPGLAAAEAHRKRFLREAQAMAAVHHDHIVIIHAVDEDNGVPFLAMEFLKGTPLDQWLKSGRKLSVPQVLRLGREIADGLAAAHEHGLIHRDIKPGNIWLDSSHKGRVKILDFGLARAVQEDVHLTQTGAIMGTPAYMAPEQARSEKVDARSDLFSLGCVLYRLCTGVMPFAGDNTMALLMSLALDTPKPVRDLNPEVPAELADLVIKLLAKDPAQRPQSAREVVRALQDIGRKSATASSATGSVVIPPPPPSAPRAAPPRDKSAPGGRKRRTRIVAAVAAGFLATVIAAAVVVIIRDKNGDKVAEVNVPPGGKLEVVDDGKKGDAPTLPPLDDAWLKRVAVFPAHEQLEAVAEELKRRNPAFDGKIVGPYNAPSPIIRDGAVIGLAIDVDKVMDISPLRALSWMQVLFCGSARKAPLADLSPLKGMSLHDLWIQNTSVSDLSPLKGMPLVTLSIAGTKVSDLAPLQGMKTLTILNCAGTPVADLSPLKGMPLNGLQCDLTAVSDLSPLAGLPLNWLDLWAAKVTDLSPLKATPLKALHCDFDPKRDADVLRSIPTLETINDKPAAEFWKAADAAAKPSVDDAWVKQVAALPAEKQVEAVAAKLKERNPGFDGKVTPIIENGVVTRLTLVADEVTDISPLQALSELRTLDCRGTWGKRNVRLADLSPLKDMKLTELTCSSTRISDLSPLKDMKLTYLDCGGTKVSNLSPLKDMKLTCIQCGNMPVSDLSPLKGMPLTEFHCDNTPVGDLSPLKGMKLTILHCWATKVSDLSPLKGMPLKVLWFSRTPISDLSPLRGMPLSQLFCDQTKVSDLSPLKDMKLTRLCSFGTHVSDWSPLKDMPLTNLDGEFQPERDAAILRSIKTLETINAKPAAEFWKDVGVAAKPPADDAWLKQVAALPAEKQVEEVVAKLKERNPGFDGKVKTTIENGVVTGLDFLVDEVTDISPVRALPALRSLGCPGSASGKGRLSDLSPLKDMKLTGLECYFTSVSDLSPLKGMMLASLNCGTTPVSDLSPLKGMPLTSLHCDHTPVSDLSPLQGMPLTELNCDNTRVNDLSALKDMKLTRLHCEHTPVSDLSPLAGMPLTYLECQNMPVSDLSPLKGMKLTTLYCANTKVTDLSPLKEMPLKNLACDFKPERDADILRSITTLEKINDKPAAEFWRDVGAKKPDPKP